MLSAIVLSRQGRPGSAHAGCITPSVPHGRQILMEQISVRLVVLLLVGVLVTVLTLHAPEVGAALVAATAMVALLAQLMGSE